jgi:rhodanese-related sulfurtransferase
MRTALPSKAVNALVISLLVAVAIAVSIANRPPEVTQVDLAEAKALIDSGAVVIDVREQEVSAGSHIPGALLIPLGILAQRMAELSIDKTRPVVVYCNEGTSRGPDGTAVLNQAGYANAVNLKSGIEGWRAAGLPTIATN